MRGPTRFRSLRLSRIAVGTVVVLAWLLAGAVPARAANNAAFVDARRHATRASHLSELGKCRQAVVEFDKALAVLHDPALLFNRAECQRKLGNLEAAINDYKRFLTDLPKAPNRAEVEARIAELRQGPVPAAAAGATAIGSTPATGSAGGASTTAAAGAPAGAAVAPAIPSRGRGQAVNLLPALPAAPSPSPASLPVLRSPPQTPSSPSPSPSASDESLTSRPWLWVGIAAVAVGLGVGAFAILRHNDTTVPPSPLGNYKF